MSILRRAIARPDLLDTTLVARVQEIINKNPEEISPVVKRNKLDKAKDKITEAKDKLVGAKDKIKDQVRKFSKGTNSNEKMPPTDKKGFRDRSQTM